MNKTLIVCTVAALLGAASVRAAVRTVTLDVPKKGIKGTIQTSPTAKTSFVGEDLLVGSTNKLQLVITILDGVDSQFSTAQLQWSLIEVNSSGTPVDRDGNSGGVQSEILNSVGAVFDGGVILFDSTGKKALASTPFGEGNGARVGPAGFAFGDHQGQVSFKGAESHNTLKISAKGSGHVDLLPADTAEAIITFSIKASGLTPAP